MKPRPAYAPGALRRDINRGKAQHQLLTVTGLLEQRSAHRWRTLSLVMAVLLIVLLAWLRSARRRQLTVVDGYLALRLGSASIPFANVRDYHDAGEANDSNAD